MKMHNKIYNILKYGIWIFIPALISLIGGLGQIYNFDTEQIVLTISLFTTFLGTITGISNIKYNKVEYISDTVGVDEDEEEPNEQE